VVATWPLVRPIASCRGRVTGIPAALLLGLLLFLLALIPLGPPAHRGTAAVWLYLDGEIERAVFVVIWSLAAGFVTDNLLRPWLISRGSDLPHRGPFGLGRVSRVCMQTRACS
jgi:AI-2E family transporter